MALYCQWMLQIAVELAGHDPVYADMALKFISHFAVDRDRARPAGRPRRAVGRGGRLLLRRHADAGRQHDPAQGALARRAAADVRGDRVRRRRRSTATRRSWSARPSSSRASPTRCPRSPTCPGPTPRAAASSASSTRRGCGGSSRAMLDEEEFLGPHGIRAISRRHLEHPCVFDWAGQRYEVHYLPAESDTGMFGGNSNWRGPVWFPMNLVILRGADAAAPLLRRPAEGRVPDRLGQRDDAGRGRRGRSAAARDDVHRGRATGAGRCSAASRSSRPTRTGTTCSCSTSTSTATTAPASARATRPAGPAPSRCCLRRLAERPTLRRLSDAAAPDGLRDQHRGLARRGSGARWSDVPGRERGTRSRRCPWTPCG